MMSSRGGTSAQSIFAHAFCTSEAFEKQQAAPQEILHSCYRLISALERVST